MKKLLTYLGIFSLFFFAAFRSLITNITTNLIDWLDYPFIVWTMYQNVEKIKAFDFGHFFDTNAFYPNNMTLLFSDTLLPQSIIALPFSLITSNPVLVFNLTFIITFFLNFIAAFYFWRLIFKKDFYGLLGGLITVFSPFTHLMIIHFQLLTFWPFFFALYFLIKNDRQPALKNIILSGVFLAIQFLASVYLAIFLLTTIAIYYLLQFIRKFKSSDLKNLALILLTFLIIDGIFIKGYIDVKNKYQIKREFGQFVSYSAHLSDYIFSTNLHSLVHKSPFFNKWNSFDKHKIGENAVFPGFTLLTLSLIGLISYKKNKYRYLLSMELDNQASVFFILTVLGLIFSFGPRLSFNGDYSGIPTIYTAVLKLPFFDTIRAVARWSFLFYLGLIYFSLRAFQDKILGRFGNKKLIITALALLLFLEYFPINIETHQEKYLSNDYEKLKSLCAKEKKVLLEFPVTHFHAGKNIVDGLSYISKVMLANSYHGCYMVNGYSGYDLPSLIKLGGVLNETILNGHTDKLTELLKENNVDIIKFNPQVMPREVKEAFNESLYKQDARFEALTDKVYLLK